MFCQVFSAIFFYQICLVQHGDIELNPAPNKKCKPSTYCYWNVNSLTTQKMQKESSVEAYSSIHNYDIMCISDTYPDSSVSLDDKNIAIEG